MGLFGPILLSKKAKQLACYREKLSNISQKKGENLMACQNICKLCNKLIISTAVNFDSATNQVIVAIPNGVYYNNERYCIIISQAIPLVVL